jgi:putative transposase
LRLLYLDEVGFSLALKPIKTWTPKGSGIQFEIPSRQGSSGRLNLIGALDFAPNRLVYRDLQGRCDGGKCAAFLDSLAEQATADTLTVVVLDNARFHKAKPIKDKEATWQAKGLYLRYLPPYSPQLNPIEGFWRVLKGFLMPRRCYASLAQLRQAVFSTLDLLGAISV